MFRSINITFELRVAAAMYILIFATCNNTMLFHISHQVTKFVTVLTNVSRLVTFSFTKRINNKISARAGCAFKLLGGFYVRRRYVANLLQAWPCIRRCIHLTETIMICAVESTGRKAHSRATSRHLSPIPDISMVIAVNPFEHHIPRSLLTVTLSAVFPLLSRPMPIYHCFQ